MKLFSVSVSRALAPLCKPFDLSRDEAHQSSSKCCVPVCVNRCCVQQNAAAPSVAPEQGALRRRGKRDAVLDAPDCAAADAVLDTLAKPSQFQQNLRGA